MNELTKGLEKNNWENPFRLSRSHSLQRLIKDCGRSEKEECERCKGEKKSFVEMYCNSAV